MRFLNEVISDFDQVSAVVAGELEIATRSQMILTPLLWSSLPIFTALKTKIKLNKFF